MAKSRFWGVVALALAGCSGEFTTQGGSPEEMRGGGEGGALDAPQDRKTGGRPGADPEPPSAGAPSTGGELGATGGEPAGDGGSGTGGTDPEPVNLDGCEIVTPGTSVTTEPGKCYGAEWDLYYCTYCNPATLNGEERTPGDFDTPGPWRLDAEHMCVMGCEETPDGCTWDGEDWQC